MMKVEYIRHNEIAFGRSVRNWLTGFVALAWVGVAFGQIDIGLKLPFSQALLNEAVIVTLQVRNNSGKIISFGSNQLSSRLRFEIEQRGGKLISVNRPGSLISGVKLMSPETRFFKIDLTRYYPLRDVSSYTIRAVIDCPSVSYSSAPVHLEVVRGFKIGKLKAGIPTEPLESRVYILEYLVRKNGEDLYLRIEDDRARLVYGAFNLGRIARVRLPKMRTDEAGNIHVLYQTAGMVFHHVSFTPYGINLVSEYSKELGGDIRLVMRPNGQVKMVSMETEKQKLFFSASTNKPTALRKKRKTATGGLFGRR